MRALQKTAAAILAVSLAATCYGIWATYQPPPPELGKQDATLAAAKHAAGDSPDAIDERTYRRAQRLSALATTPDEQSFAQLATQLADHELDAAFAAALRQIEAHPPVLSPEAQKIADRLQRSQKQLETDQAQVTQLAGALAQPNAAQNSNLQDRLDLAQSQLELDKDEVAAANQDLMAAGGNVHQRIQKMMQDHKDAATNHQPGKTAATDPLAKLHGLVERYREWQNLRKKERYLTNGATQATASAAELTTQRRQLATELADSKSNSAARRATPLDTAPAAAPLAATKPSANSSTPTPNTTAAARRATPAGTAPTNASTSTSAAPPPAATDTTALLATTRQLVADQKLLTSLDERISDRRQLADVYGKWQDVVASQATGVLHEILLSITTIIVILLLLLYVDQWLERLVGRTKLDRRQVETLRSVARVSLQILGIIVILLVLIGMPTQLGTMLGIVGAGLTVALKDFIVAFIGWLVLMGKNGMRLGDWVEINGVSGEVIELGMFHTVLLETGNWTDAGHPTGRRVTFTNSFAISGHYFNFSTSGQWLWDEVLVLVPYERDANPIADVLYKEVMNATTEGAKLAETEWKNTAQSRRGIQVTATPGLSIRPAVGGVEVAIRYVTKASERFNLRARLYKTAVGMLGQSAQPRAAS